MNVGFAIVGKYPIELMRTVPPLVDQLTWYWPPPPEHTVLVEIRHGFVAPRLWPRSVTDWLTPASATVSDLLHSIDNPDWRSAALPASSDTASRTIMIEISNIAMTRE